MPRRLPRDITITVNHFPSLLLPPMGGATTPPTSFFLEKGIEPKNQADLLDTLEIRIIVTYKTGSSAFWVGGYPIWCLGYLKAYRATGVAAKGFSILLLES